MSSLKVRTEFRAAISNWLTTAHPAIPFYETVNTRQEPTDNTWVSADFQTNFSERMAMGCNSKAEYGTVDVFIYTRAGRGDTEALTLADELTTAIEHFSNNGVVVETVEPPSEAFNGDARRWYGVYVTIEYVSYS